MSRENLDFTNFKLLFLKPIFHGLSPSAKMAKVEMIRQPRSIEERIVEVGHILTEYFYELPLNDHDINDLFNVVAEIMGAALDVDQLGYDREDVIARLRSMCEE